MATADPQVAVIGGGVVGCAVAHALARRGVAAVLLESEPGLALGASGSNSGILHSGFDARPGELETTLILRSAALRADLRDELGVVVWSCGAVLRAGDEEERAAVGQLAENARANGVEAHLDEDAGSLTVPGEAVTDPVAFAHALAHAACAGGASLRLNARVSGLAGEPGGGLAVELDGGKRLRVGAVVNCAGLYADEVAHLAGDHPVTVYPRKGEFIVFAPAPDEPLERILLPVPSRLGKGVLVFPTVDRLIIAGPTARERDDKRDWSVEGDAAELIMARATRMYPALARAERIGAYAGLRPAGREANYVIERSPTLDGLLHVAAIRSTGLSASLAIGEYVVGLLAGNATVELGPLRSLAAGAPLAPAGPWWERAARHHSRSGSAR
jgi:glycerol-3-phosphate dehydrogenase